MAVKWGKIAKQVLGTVAPMAATAIGGPFAPLAMNIMKSVLGTEDESLIEQQIASSDPDTLLKLREVDNQLRTRMRELDIEEQDLHVKNTQGARDLAKATSVWFQFALTVVAMFAFGLLLYVLIIKGQVIPTENKDIAIFLTGQLSGFVALGYNFFLGSSKGSKESKDIAATLQKREQ